MFWFSPHGLTFPGLAPHRMESKSIYSCVRLLSLTIILTFIHMFVCISRLFWLLLTSIPWVNISQFIYPFSYWWAPGLFCLFASLTFFLYFFLSFSFPRCMTCGVLVLQQGVRPESNMWETQTEDTGSPENCWLHGISIGESSPKGFHLNPKTWPHQKVSRLQCQMPHSKQLGKQEHKPTN